MQPAAQMSTTWNGRNLFVALCSYLFISQVRCRETSVTFCLSACLHEAWTAT